MTNQPAATSSSSPRLYYLDTLRVIAILLVFLFHAVHPFDLLIWHVKNIEQSLTLTVILMVLWMFGMPFFFLIAGTGSWLALRRRTAKQYIVERTRRLLVPLVFFSLISFFILQYYEWENKLYRGLLDISFPGYLQATWEWLKSLGVSPLWLSLGGHLWFVGFLYAFAVLTLPILIWLKSGSGARFIGWLAQICRRRGGLLVFFLPLVIIRYLLSPFFPDEHDVSDFIFQGAFFIIGFLLFTHEEFLNAVRRDGWLLGGVGLAAVVAILTTYMVNPEATSWLEAFGTPGFYFLMGGIVLVALTWSLAMLSLGMRYMDKDRAWVRYAQEISLPFFIVHQPVILFIASYVVKWDTGIPIKMLVTVISSFFISWGLVEFIVKRVGFLRFLFGITTPQSSSKKGEAVQPTPAS